ncbi:hypothetical protein [Nitratireductor sp. GCM10026969]|uniref:hypothetical protein n=1 Tax=Nitratireductor sp. GCM10026969 TaxID=3252645 RepID=UPI0036102EDE
MLMKLDTTWLVFAVATVAMLAYMFAIALRSLLEEAGFGPVLGAAIITCGFFGAIQAVNFQGVRFQTMLEAAIAGLAGAFVLYLVLVLLKLVLDRLV